MIPRWLPDEPLPAYAHKPGRTPHPISDPRGHSYGKRPVALELFDPDQWRTCRPYLRGIDLFNHGFFWEAHEEWESIWHAAGRKGPVADFIKGLIQLAVAGVKLAEGRDALCRAHVERAAELFRSSGLDRCMGMNVTTLLEVSRYDDGNWRDAVVRVAMLD